MSPLSTQLLKTPTTHAKTIVASVDNLYAYFTETLVTSAWNPLGNLPQNYILKALSKINTGFVKLVTTEKTWEFGSPSSGLQVTLLIKSDGFWKRVALSTDLGLAEAFMFGDVDCDDISSLLKILILNRKDVQQHVTNPMSYILSFGHALAANRFKGSVSNSKANISAHYDLGNTMFQAFLSDDMNYSSAIFKDFNGDLSPTSDPETLEAAQMRKMKSILKKAKIQPGDRVLEIGTGFGALSILAAQTVRCTIETVTLSVHQAQLARKRIADAGLSDSITVHNIDFRECLQKLEWAGSFDKFISVEMIENVGKEYITEYWKVVDWALKKTDAVGVVQVISMPEARIPAYDSGTDFIQKWVIFPGTYIPSLQFLLESMTDGSGGRLTVDSVYNIGPHYARTLREWKRKFLRNWESIISKALVDQYGLDTTELEIFRRKWIYYFDYCEAGFATRTLGDHCITFTREGNMAFGCDYET